MHLSREVFFLIKIVFKIKRQREGPYFEHSMANFCKELDSKCQTPMTVRQYLNSADRRKQRSCVNKGVWLCSGRTLFMNTEICVLCFSKTPCF